MTPLFNVGVYCSASNNIDQNFLDYSQELAVALVKEGFGLVYGGGEQGIMGNLAKKVIKEKGHVIGIIPEKLIAKEKAFKEASRLILVQSMRERKYLLESFSDAFIVLPGGIGTFDEMFEILTLKSVGYCNKPLILLNIKDFYTPLINYLLDLKEKGFITPSFFDILIIKDSVPEAIKYLKDAFIPNHNNDSA